MAGRLAEVTNDGGLEALVAFALPQGVGGLHEQVFQRERSGEPRRGRVEAGVEQHRLSQGFVGSTRLREFGGSSRFPEVVGRSAETNEVPVDTKLRLASRAKQPNGDVVYEREVSDEPRRSALLFEQLEHAWWK